MKKNLTQFRMGYGPMSLEIIDILDNYSFLNPLMIIGSRNQVDTYDGYVCDSKYLANKFCRNKNVLVCRDHCGPYFKDSDKGLSLYQALENCIRTIRDDIEAGFDLIHVDVSRVNDSFQVADKIIKAILDINSKIMLEFGSEENTGKNLEDTLQNLESQLIYCSQYKKNIKFFVSQTGSYIQNSQVGHFDLGHNKMIADKIHSFGFLLKEHNGDYLTQETLRLRQLANIDAINVAPQLGVIQTSLLYDLKKHSPEWFEFANVAYAGNKYQRWLPLEDQTNKLSAVLVSGHYFFKTKEYHKLVDSIGREVFENLLKNEIFKILDLYRAF